MTAGATTGPEAGMRTYAHQQARTLLRRLAFQMGQGAKLGEAEAVHDLRVAIRRFNQCLRVVRQYLPKREARKIRKRLGEIMDMAGAVRDRDIALGLAVRAGAAKRSRLVVALARERKQAEQELASAARRAGRDNFSRKWRARLGL